MEFWGVEVKPGQNLKVSPGEEKVLHLSQASLGEVKKDKGNDSILLHVKIDGQKLVVGTLSADNCTHISYDLVFEKEFELSHSWKNGSIYFCDSDSDLGEDYPLDLVENGKPEDVKAKPTTNKVNAAKTDSSSAKKVKLVDPKKGKKPEDDDDEDDKDADSEEDESDDEAMLDAEDDSDDEDEDGESSDEDEATPKKVQQGKKRPAESATKADKKAKLVTPQKSGADGKKGGGHTATPYPKGGKTPASGDKSKQQTPKSAGQISCKACPKTFTSETAMQSHSKAKHSGGK
ncbi:zinc finger protein [Macleaya cordata]|uniref:Zinc finger protein n=1 Tax=Macleaya cordata TaxID=56857 RepID=A0A200Q2E8_MACCD|nr:zinc finger protein [Macleaya cordata]